MAKLIRLGANRRAAFLGALAASVLIQRAEADNKYWDTADTTGLQPGTGQWDEAGTIAWNSDSGGLVTPRVGFSSGDAAFFQTGASSINTVTVSGTVNPISITYGSGPVTNISGGLISLGSGGITGAGSSGTGTMTIDSDINLTTATNSWSNSTGQTLIVNGNVSGSTTLSITQGGTGSSRRTHMNGTNSLTGITAFNTSSSTIHQLILGGSTTLTGALGTNGTQTTPSVYAGANNTFGSINFSNGTIALGGTNTLDPTNSVTNDVAIAGGGQLIIQRDANIGGLTKSINFNSGNLRILGTDLTTFGTRTITYSSGANLKLDIEDESNTFTLNKIYNGAGTSQLGKLGRGTVVLTQANTYTGATTVRGGVLEINKNLGGSINNVSSITMAGGTLRLVGQNGAITTQGTGNLLLGTTSGTAYSSTIAVDGGSSTSTTLGLGTIVATTNGTSLNFSTSGANAAITTTTAPDATGIYGGRITFNGSNWATSLSGGSPYTLSGLGTYSALSTVTGTDTNNSLVTTSATLTGSPTTNTLKINNTSVESLTIGSGNILTLTSGGLLYTGSANYSVTAGTLKSGTATNSDLIVHQNGTGVLTIGSVIANGTGTSVLTKTGPGTLVLSGNNTYSGATFINGGVLEVTVVSGTNNNLGSSASLGMNLNDGTLRYMGVSATRGGSIQLGTMGGTFEVVPFGTTLTLSGGISDGTQTSEARAGRLTKRGAGTLLISNASDFTGGVTIEAGVLQAGHSGALNSSIPNIVTFTSGSTGTLRLNGFSPSVFGLNSNAASPGATFVENSHASTASTLSVITTFASEYAGTIRNGGAASLSIVKQGGNTLTLTGANTYSGTTTVQAGKLLVNNLAGSGTGSGAVTVAQAGTLGGTGTLAGLVTVQSGGHLATGNSVGIETFEGGLTFNTGSNFDWEHDAGNALGTAGTIGSGFDQAAITTAGNLSITTGAKLNLFFAGGTSFTNSFWDTSHSWTIVNNTGAGSASGNFANGDLSIFVNNALTGSANTITGEGNFTTLVSGNDLILNWNTLAAGSSISLTNGTPGGYTNRADGTAATDLDQTTAGNINIAGSSGSFSSEIDDLQNVAGVDDYNQGAATLSQTPNSPIYAMLWLAGENATTLEELRSQLDGLADIEAYTDASLPGGAELINYNSLSSGYSQFGGWDLLVKFEGGAIPAGTTSLNWDFSGQSGILVDKIAVVPEPATLSVLGIGAAGLLLGRRRRRASQI